MKWLFAWNSKNLKIFRWCVIDDVTYDVIGAISYKGSILQTIEREVTCPYIGQLKTYVTSVGVENEGKS